jgi:hypothetical protein
VIEVTLPEKAANLPRTPLACHVLAVAGRSVVLEAMDKLVVLRLPKAIEDSLLVFRHDNSLVALKGVVIVEDVPGDLRFVAHAREGQRRRRPTRAEVTVPVKVRVPAEEQTLETTTLNVSVGGMLIECELPVTVGERLEIELAARARADPSTVLVAVGTVQRVGQGLVAVAFDQSAPLAYRSELARLVIEERRATRLRREARSLAATSKIDF